MTYIVSLVGLTGNEHIEYIHAKSPQEAAELLRAAEHSNSQTSLLDLMH